MNEILENGYATLADDRYRKAAQEDGFERLLTLLEAKMFCVLSANIRTGLPIDYLISYNENSNIP